MNTIKITIVAVVASLVLLATQAVMAQPVFDWQPPVGECTFPTGETVLDPGPVPVACGPIPLCVQWAEPSHVCIREIAYQPSICQWTAADAESEEFQEALNIWIAMMEPWYRCVIEDLGTYIMDLISQLPLPRRR